MHMRIQKNTVLLIISFMFLAVSGCAAKTGPYIDFRQTVAETEPEIDSIIEENAEKPLRIAVCPVLSKKNTIEAYRKISEYIGLELGKKTMLIERKSYAEINVLLANGGADVAFLANGAYASYTGIEEIEPLVMQLRFGVPYYYSYIIVPKSSAAEKLEDLRGKTFAFTDPLSFSGKIALIFMLDQLDEKPETFFSNYIYTYGHQNSLEAVANSVVDGAAIGSLVYDSAALNQPELLEKIRIIAVSEKGGTGPVVARKSLGKEQLSAIKELFLNMHEEPDLKEALSVLMVDEYIEPQLDFYERLQEMLHEKNTE